MILGERVRLRPIERDDLPTFVRWFADPEVRDGLAQFLPLSLAAEERWFERLLDRDDHLFAIEGLVGKRWLHIGSCGIEGLHPRHRSAGVGILIGEKQCWNKGYGTEAMRLLCRFGFDSLNLHRIELCVYAYNPRARRCYEKVGFQLEGTFREAVWHDGRYHDVYHMGLLRGELTADA